MAYGVNGTNIPEIQSEYWLGTKSSNSCFRREEFKTRAEKYAEAEANFTKVYLREYEKKISKDEEGIVVIQLGKFPCDFDVTINPLSSDYCLRHALMLDKIMHVPYVFESRTYWLSRGRIKLLIDGRNAVNKDSCQEAMSKVCKTASYVGEYVIELSRGRKHPYRLWEDNGKFWLMGLLNGVIVSLDEKPEMVEMPNVFCVGEVRFTRYGDGNFIIS